MPSSQKKGASGSIEHIKLKSSNIKIIRNIKANVNIKLFKKHKYQKNIIIYKYKILQGTKLSIVFFRKIQFITFYKNPSHIFSNKK